MQIDITIEEIELISDALNALQGNRYAEFKWANGDPYIIESYETVSEKIERLFDRLKGEPADNRDRVGVPEPHIVTCCGDDGSAVVSYEDGYECPYCHATGVRHFCPDCGAKMYYTE